MPKRATSTSFKKGDPRIWRGGRPKSFNALRDLAQQIAHETVRDAEGVARIVKDDRGQEHILTVAEVILRQWAQSKNPQLQQKFIEVAFGKVPDGLELSGTVANVEMSLSEWRTNAERRRRESDATLAIDDDAETGAAGE